MTDQEIIEVVTAHKEGKKIQYRLKYDYPELDWLNLPVEETIYWNFIKTDYRVAPEPRKPREDWIHESAIIHREPVGHDFVKVREVLE